MKETLYESLSEKIKELKEEVQRKADKKDLLNLEQRLITYFDRQSKSTAIETIYLNEEKLLNKVKELSEKIFMEQSANLLEQVNDLSRVLSNLDVQINNNGISSELKELKDEISNLKTMTHRMNIQITIQWWALATLLALGILPSAAEKLFGYLGMIF